MLTKMKVFMLPLVLLLLSGCIGADSYFESPPLPVLSEPPSRDYRQLGMVSTYIDMKVGSASWRSTVNYRLASDAQRQYGSDAHAVVILSYDESARHARGMGMAISYSPGPGIISGSSPATAVTQQKGEPVTAKTAGVSTKSQSPAMEDNLRDVILYRENRVVNSGAIYQVSWQGDHLGTLTNGSALRVRLPPGSQTLTIGYVTNKRYMFEEEITVADQGATYVNFLMKFSFTDNPRSHMTIRTVPASEGQAAVSALW